MFSRPAAIAGLLISACCLLAPARAQGELGALGRPWAQRCSQPGSPTQLSAEGARSRGISVAQRQIQSISLAGRLHCSSVMLVAMRRQRLQPRCGVRGGHPIPRRGWQFKLPTRRL